MRSFRDYSVNHIEFEDEEMNFGVYVVKKNGSGVIRACEVFNLKDISQDDMDKIMQEIRVMASIRHPFIVMYYESFVLEMTSQLVMITEHCSNGNLHEFIDDIQSELSKQGYENAMIFTEKQSLKIFTNMVLALKELNRRGLVHRNLNPSNLYVNDESQVKFGDFTYTSFDRVRNAAKTKEIHYMSPEMLTNQPVTIKSDVWSIGVILFEMTFGKKPFDSPDRKILEQKILAGEYTIPNNVKGCPCVKLIIDACLKLIPEQRPGLDLLLRYPFLQEAMKENFERFPELEAIEKETHPIAMVRELKFDASNFNLTQINKQLSAVRQERFRKILLGKENINDVPWPKPLGSEIVEPFKAGNEGSNHLPVLKDTGMDRTFSTIQSPQKPKVLKPPARIVEPLPPLNFEIRRFANSNYLDAKEMREKLYDDYRDPITDRVSTKKMKKMQPGQPLILLGAYYGKKAERARWNHPNLE